MSKTFFTIFSQAAADSEMNDKRVRLKVENESDFGPLFKALPLSRENNCFSLQ